jgi:hypothetical protein
VFRSGAPFAATIDHGFVAAFPVHDLSFAAALPLFVAFTTWGIGFARNLAEAHQKLVHMTLIPVAIWFVVLRVTPASFADVSSFGLLYCLTCTLIAAVAGSAAAVRS